MTEDTSMRAGNPDNQGRLDDALNDPNRKPCECGAPILYPEECAACYGGNDYGRPFCPVEDYCCGC